MGSLAPAKRNVVVIGGSYVGTKAAEQLAVQMSDRFRVLLIEKNSHFQHLFAFPRFAVTTKVNTHKAFIPYGTHTFAGCPPESASFIQARVTGLSKSSIQLDRQVVLDGVRTETVPYAFLVIATGTRLTPPSSIPGTGAKLGGVEYLRKHSEKVMRSTQIVVVGGGAVGVQTATDLKELYPDKSVTVVHSRRNLMNKFNSGLHDIIMARFVELGVKTKLGSRVKVPSEALPANGPFNVGLEDGSTVPADLVIICTGQTPQSEVVRTLSSRSVDESGFVKVSKTLQIADAQYPNVFAVGDVADTGAHKAAKPAVKQVEVVVRNVEHMLAQEELENYDITDPAAIHLTLGITTSVVFRNPATESSDPFIKWKNDGTLDMGIDDVWSRRGGGADASL